MVRLRHRVPASFVTQQLLGSYAVQSDIGDYDVEEYDAGIAYIKDMQFVPGQSDELLEKIQKLHVQHRSATLTHIVPIQIQIQMGICRVRLTNCPGALTNVRMLCETGEL